MASIGKVVQITVSLLTAGAKAAGFGTLLIADYNTRFSELYRVYEDTDAMITDGFVTGDAALAAVGQAFAQSPSPLQVAVGRRTHNPTITYKLTPVLVSPKTYSVKTVSKTGVKATASYSTGLLRTLGYDGQSGNFTVGDVVTGATSGATGVILADTDGGTTGTLRLGSVVGAFVNNDVLTDEHTGHADATGADAAFTETTASLCTGIAAALNDIASAPVTASVTDSSTTVTVVAASATDFFSLEVVDQALMLVKNTTADNNTANDLDAINLENDSWYGVTLTSQGDAEVLAAADWAETNEKLLIQAVSAGDCLTTSTADVMSTNKTANRFRSALIYHQNPAQHAGACWLGSTFPLDPGSLTFAFRQLRNLDTSPLNPTQITHIEAKNGNYFTDIAGVSFTLNGKLASGEWIDITRDSDWFESQLGVAHLNVKLNNDKVPMTDKGIALEEAAMRKVCKLACDAGFLDETTLQFVVPKVKDISDTARKARILDKLQLSANVQGAIHVTKIRATITE